LNILPIFMTDLTDIPVKNSDKNNGISQNPCRRANKRRHPSKPSQSSMANQQIFTKLQQNPLQPQKSQGI